MKKKVVTAKITETHTETSVSRTLEVPIMEGYVDMKLPEKHKFGNGNFVTVFSKALRNIAMFGKLTKNEATLLLYLIGSCTQDNSICIDLNILAEDLQMDKGNVSKAVKGLVARNIVLRKDGYRYGNAPLPMKLSLNYDQINYNVAYNGKIKTYKENKKKHPVITEVDGRTLLEGHREGQPYHILQDNGRFLTVNSDGAIVGSAEQMHSQVGEGSRQMLQTQVDAANRQIIDLVNGEDEDPRQMHLDFDNL